jgi:hypothetical protein
MSLLLQQSLFEAQDSTLISFSDPTGVYDAVNNPGGYGAPNVLSSAITSVQLTITFDEVPSPTILSLVVVTGTVTSGTFTDALGNVSPIVLTDLNLSSFPFQKGAPIELPASLFVPAATFFEDQYITIEYIVSDGTTDYVSTEKWLLSQNACCCLKKAWYKFSIGQCQRQDPMKIQDAINGLNAANDVADYLTAKESLVRLKQLCSNCGCGCGGH